MVLMPLLSLLFFFFNDTATPEIYTLSLHDALPICPGAVHGASRTPGATSGRAPGTPTDRKSTRLNSSHGSTAYADFCLKKKSPSTSDVEVERVTSYQEARNHRLRDD